MRSSPESLGRAFWMVDLSLLDVRVQDRDDLRTALMLSLDGAGFRDEAAARAAIDRIVRAEPRVIENADWLSETLFEVRRGIPVLRSGPPLARRLIRIVDPDAMVSLCPHLRLAARDAFDWPAVPMDDGGPIASLLRGGSVETHIHLGGALPPTFYWLLLMGAELGYETLGWVRSARRGHARIEAWQQAVTRAAWLRLALALTVERWARERGEPLLFPHLPPLVDDAWSSFDAEEPPDHAFDTREAIFTLSRGLRLAEPDHPRDWPFSDPLRSPPADGRRSHYAAGERRLLACVGRLLRNAGGTGDPGGQLETRFLEYLRTRNAFHSLMVHDHGSDGLLRFVETFDRRGFVFGRSRKQPGGRRKRFRRNLIDLERSRMIAALDSQLADPFDRALQGNREAPLRRIEMRVSMPNGPLLLRTLRAWMEGIADHLRPAEPRGIGPRSQVGLLFHLIKFENTDRAEGRALETAQRLRRILEGYPNLRPFIVGFDAAGSERATPPRRFLKAFHEIADLASRHRPAPHHPPIRLGFTFHVGEDVVDLLTGLRHMDEVASLLLHPSEGGRLGHALALGDDPRRFYASRGFQSEPTLGSHLLDLVWACGRLATTDHASACSWLQQQILTLAEGANVEVSAIARCYQAMDLDPPRSGRLLSEGDLLRELGFEGDPERTAFPRVDERWCLLLENLQRLLRERFCRSRICIEANPTSNLVIGGFSGYGHLPYSKLCEAGLPLSINTDDPGLFMTSLPGELAALYEMLTGTLSHRQILAWLADRAFDAEHSTFLGQNVPLGENGDLDALFRFLPG